jgi:hypothetical protein
VKSHLEKKSSRPVNAPSSIFAAAARRPHAPHTHGAHLPARRAPPSFRACHSGFLVQPRSAGVCGEVTFREEADSSTSPAAPSAFPCEAERATITMHVNV